MDEAKLANLMPCPNCALRARFFYPALACSVIFLLSVLLVQPNLESGTMDDWSYVRTAQMLAATGHIEYNGWSAPMLLWPLYVAAFFIKVFGFSFLVVRSTIVLEALCTTLLLHCTFVRAGVGQWNASLGVLTIVLSPIFLVASTAFLSDIPGMLAVVLCFYICLRALQAEAPRSAAIWLCFAGLSNAALGTARQIAWLGVLILVPCTMWLLRRSRLVLITGTLTYIVSGASIWWALHWFNRQPYILPEHLLEHKPSPAEIGIIPTVIFRLVLDLVMFLVPIALAFLPSLKRISRRSLLLVGAVASFTLTALFRLRMQHMLSSWTAPYLLFPRVHPQSVENTFTATSMPIKGPAPFALSMNFRLLLTLVVLLAVLALLAAFLDRRRRAVGTDAGQSSISFRNLLTLTLPFMLLYVGLLLPRGIFSFDYDRYYLLLLPPTVLLLLRFFQRRNGVRLPLFCTALLAVWGAYSIVTLHDNFVTYRANLFLCNRLQAAGISRTAIDGGWEFNHYTQVMVGSFVYQTGIRLPDGSILPDLPHSMETACSMEALQWTPDLRPRYAIAYPTSLCPRVPGFEPVRFRTWLPPQQREAYVVQYIAQAPIPPQ